MMPNDIIRKGTLASGRPWELVPSARKDHHLKEGKQLILNPTDGTDHVDLTEGEIGELLGLAYAIAEELSEEWGEKGRWRLVLNGRHLTTRPTFHVHILLPTGEDTLARLVG